MRGFEAPVHLEVFRTARGSAPFEDWLDSLTDRRGALAIAARLARLRSGNPGLCKAIGEGFWELKVDVGPGYRVYLRVIGARTLLILCGGSKASQDNDISKAKAYWTDRQRRQRAR